MCSHCGIRALQEGEIYPMVPRGMLSNAIVLIVAKLACTPLGRIPWGTYEIGRPTNQQVGLGWMRDWAWALDLVMHLLWFSSWHTKSYRCIPVEPSNPKMSSYCDGLAANFHDKPDLHDDTNCVDTPERPDWCCSVVDWRGTPRIGEKTLVFLFLTPLCAVKLCQKPLDSSESSSAHARLLFWVHLERLAALSSCQTVLRFGKILSRDLSSRCLHLNLKICIPFSSVNKCQQMSIEFINLWLCLSLLSLEFRASRPDWSWHQAIV